MTNTCLKRVVVTSERKMINITIQVLRYFRFDRYCRQLVFIHKLYTLSQYFCYLNVCRAAANDYFYSRLIYGLFL